MFLPESQAAIRTLRKALPRVRLYFINKNAYSTQVSVFR